MIKPSNDGLCSHVRRASRLGDRYSTVSDTSESQRQMRDVRRRSAVEREARIWTRVSNGRWLSAAMARLGNLGSGESGGDRLKYPRP